MTDGEHISLCCSVEVTRKQDCFNLRFVHVLERAVRLFMALLGLMSSVLVVFLVELKSYASRLTNCSCCS